MDCTPPTPSGLGGKSQACLGGKSQANESHPCAGVCPDPFTTRCFMWQSVGVLDIDACHRRHSVWLSRIFSSLAKGSHGFPWVPMGTHDFPVLRVSCDSLPHGGRWPNEMIPPRLPSDSGGQASRTVLGFCWQYDERDAPTITMFWRWYSSLQETRTPPVASMFRHALHWKTHLIQEMGFDLNISRCSII